MDKILIIDFGSQYTQLIARRVRELNVYCEIFPYDASIEKIDSFEASGIILSGGPNSVYENETPNVSSHIFELGIPILGICYGMQTMVNQLGGTVVNSNDREFGYAEIRAHGHSDLLKGIEDKKNDEGHGLLDVWMSHGDKVNQLPDDFEIICSNQSTPIAGIANKSKHFYGLQFHPEVTHTKKGFEIIKKFVIDISACKPEWNMPNYVETAVKKIQEAVGSDEVILGLSGGVDSSVAAALIHKAIGDQLTCVFVDHGLLRLNEAEIVMKTFQENLGVMVIHVNAEGKFLKDLEGITDPEEKRKIIGRDFVEIFQEQSKEYPEVKWLAQGTIYPDVIESSESESKEARVIKSHHNVGGLPDDMKMELVEPLRDLFKDEVRTMGSELGLPLEMLNRHPFPGPGLGVRILGEISQEKVSILQNADAIFIEELTKAGLYDQVSQAFCAFLPIKSVGVVGDERRYADVIAIRAVETVDFMTATWARLPYDFLAHVSNRIVNELEGVSRVVYDISSKPPATIEWE